MIAEIFYF